MILGDLTFIKFLYLVEIDLVLVLPDEVRLPPVRPDGGGAADGLAKVAVDGRAGDGLHALNLCLKNCLILF